MEYFSFSHLSSRSIFHNITACLCPTPFAVRFDALHSSLRLIALSNCSPIITVKQRSKRNTAAVYSRDLSFFSACIVGHKDFSAITAPFRPLGQEEGSLRELYCFRLSLTRSRIHTVADDTVRVVGVVVVQLTGSINVADIVRIGGVGRTQPPVPS